MEHINGNQMLYILMYTSQMATWMLVMCVCTHNGARQSKRVGAYEQETPRKCVRQLKVL